VRRPTRGRRPAALSAGTGRLLAVLVSSGLALTALAPTALAAGAIPTRTSSASVSAVDAEEPVEVVVETLSPRAPVSATQPFRVAGRLVNRGDAPVHGLRVQLLVDGVLRSRSALAAADDERAAGRLRGEQSGPASEDLGPGASTTFAVELPVGELGLTQLGVYPVGLQVRGRVDDSRRATTLGSASTFVPWFPEGPPQPTRIAFLWPLVDIPQRTPSGVFLDDDLAKALARPSADGAGGRLGRLLAAARAGAPGECDPDAVPTEVVPPAGAPEPPQGAAPAVPLPCRGEPVPLTYAVDPALLDAVQALAASHRVLGEDGQPRTRPGHERAADWLADLQEALAGAPGRGDDPPLPAADLLALPYADPDVVALTRTAGALRGDVDQLRALGTRIAADVTGAEPLADVAWPPAGPLPSAALDATVAAGAEAVVLGPDALPAPRSDTARTPGTRTDLSAATAGRVTALVVDDGLSSLLATTAGDRGWQGERLAEQRWLAETAMLAAERPGESRTVLVALPRRSDVDPEVAGPALRDAGRLPWLCPVAVADVAVGRERCPGAASVATEPEDRGALEPGDGEDELSPMLLRRLAPVSARAAQLTDDVLVAGSDAAAQTKARLLKARGRVVSSAWRDDPAGGRRMLDLLDQEVTRLRDQVRLSTSGQALLTSTSGVIDVVISNELDQPVTVGVALNDPIEARLTSTDTDLRTIGASQAVPVRVQVETRTSGQFVVRATLLDREGRPFGEPVELVARSTGYGRLALAVTGVGAGVLLVAVGVRIVRRALHRERPPGAGTPA
jgi:hypothetical protein